MGSHFGVWTSVERGISRGISPAWKKEWSEISSIEGRLFGSGQRREVIRSCASWEMGLVVGKSYWLSLILLLSTSINRIGIPVD